VGQLPVQMMYLTDLKFMALELNALSGPIPEWVGELTNIKFMALGGNKLEGTIPSAIAAMTHLSELSLEDNVLGGDVNVLNQIPSLTRLFLGNNKFEGFINDSFLGGLQILRELDLSSNQFTGTLPIHFFNLEILDLHDNDLEGGIPKPVHTAYPLKYLLLHNNRISGVLHNSIAYIKSLTRLDVSNNELTGPLPESIADMKDMQYLYLANNEWAEGSFPEWRNLTGLLELSLKGTKRVDEIPEWIGHEMRSLQLLSLDDNLLSGEIPETLGNLKGLEYLLLNQNNLTGTIPATLKNLHQLSK
jgi:Leucine-rich repeat (LRR) protein